MNWSSIRNLLNNQISQIFIVFGAASPIAIIFKVGLGFEEIRYFYVGWSVILLCFIIFRVFCPQIVLDYSNEDKYYEFYNTVKKNGGADWQYEFEYFYNAANADKIEKYNMCPEDLRSHDFQSGEVLFGDKQIYYLAKCKYKYLDYEYKITRYIITTLIILAIALMQYPTFSAVLTIVGG